MLQRATFIHCCADMCPNVNACFQPAHRKFTIKVEPPQ